ncbi:ATP-binding protein [Dolichospermum sp. UHCC 0684]|uniref:sensor histidine kinase n=1 Tax=Nostocales TaxID=1161 RepID=UPI00029B7A98|nr:MULTISPECIES: ATP-binding protein [Nostocales]AFW96590.1 two-component sensor histidine kinase [Anabaena sp. 90]MEA5531315.1 ATP-binding protein [Dolichospermum sp. UHCC 0684]MTJ19330.1 two-component sensor histidine kinase [Dolichospermum sp. UHCC 0299]MTJ34548.1 two-component sensor histidine kinase [Dolichospermum sp. UHCC 0260]MTJ38166.1 two-component sensor histidine kinase [Dolichospermum sp. UHCC 0406]
MAKSRQSSFRQILVTRILLVFIPVLLVGEMVALNKARSSLLNTAQQNLTESAVNKGEKITDNIAALRSNLITASQTKVIQSGSTFQIEQFLKQLKKQLPTQTDCLQLTRIKKGEIIASSCGVQEIMPSGLSLTSNDVDIQFILPSQSGKTGKRDKQNQLQLFLSIPVSNQRGNLAYRLSMKTTLYQQNPNHPGSLTGFLVVIAEDGKVLAHPLPERIGTNIKDYADVDRIQAIVKNALGGSNNSSNLSFIEGQELVAGFTATTKPITTKPSQRWIVLAVTSVENALFGLEEIKLILIVLTVGLIGASLLASFYLVPYLAGPVEELRDYAINLHSHHAAQPIPRNFKIREFNQLAQALDQMVERLKDWAEELEIAWKEAKSANQVKSQFLATTSHELRNPLNIIINCVRLVRDDLCDSREEELEFLKKADDTAIHLLGIINDLLDISKIEAGKLSVITVPLDLRQLLLEVINLQSVNIQYKGLQLICDIGDKPIPIKSDSIKLKQVLINIIGNATKFTDEGSIQITMSINRHQQYVLVSIKDTGIGIDPGEQGKLFRPFVMVDGTTTRKFEGTGLGLAISRNLIELMGGKITLESLGLNQGTTVIIKLPLIDLALLPNPEKKDVVINGVRS